MKKRKKKQKFIRPDYRKYIRSKKWKMKRWRIIVKRGRKCERCGTRGKVQLHHTTYERLGRERKSDLILLCEGCHRNEHEGQVAGVFDPMTEEFVAMVRVW